MAKITDSEEDFFTKLRFQLLRSNPFFGSLIHRVGQAWTNEQHPFPTAATNGHMIYFNKEFMESLTHDQQLTLFGHELFHCVFVHPWRMEKMSEENAMKANIAGDFLINFVLKELGFKELPGWLYNKDYSPDKYNLEQLTKLIQVQKIKMPAGGNDVMKPGKGQGKNGKKPSEREIDNMEHEMKGILKQAADHARTAGRGSPALDRMIDEWLKPKIDWRSVLHDFMQRKAKEDITWKKPSRRGLPLDIYLPTKDGFKCGHVGVAIDLSGSIGQSEVALFQSHMKYVFDTCKPEKVTVITFDDGICDEWEFDEMPDKLRFKGGGGTDFRPVFKRFDQIASDPSMVFEALIFMTDLCGPFPDQAPKYPVFFLSTYKDGKAPWGEVLYAEELDNRNR